MGLQFCGKGARTADGEEGDVDPLCVERQPRSLSSTSDSWGLLSEHAAGTVLARTLTTAPLRRLGSQCVTLTHCLLCL